MDSSFFQPFSALSNPNRGKKILTESGIIKAQDKFSLNSRKGIYHEALYHKNLHKEMDNLNLGKEYSGKRD